MKKIKDNRGSLLVSNGNLVNQILVSDNPYPYTFRGMHYQDTPRQTKVIKVLQGKIIDFIYNLETNNVEFYELHPDSDELYVDKNYAHGYLTLEPNTIVFYLVTGEWNAETEHSIPWNTIPLIKDEIEQIVGDNQIIISDKDKIGK